MSSKQAKQQELSAIREFIDSDRFNDVKYEAKMFQQQHVIPTSDQIKKAYAILLEFLRTTKPQRIIYGGTAVDLLMRSKDPNAAIYRDNCFPDIDFYSPDPYRDTVELCNRLQRAGLIRINAREAIKDYTFKIRVEEASDELADISYVPTNVFQYLHDNCSSQYQGKDGWLKMTGLRYINANVQTIDLLNVLTTPMTGWHKVAKQLERQTLVANQYLIPMKDPSSQSGLDSWFTTAPVKPIENIRKRAQEVLRQNSSCWLRGGCSAYRHYLQVLPDGNKRMLANMPIECYVGEPSANTQTDMIVKKLIQEFSGWHFAIRKYNPLMSWMKRRYVITAKKQDTKHAYWIGIINEYDNQCIASRTLDDIPTMTFWGCLRSCYINQHWCRLNNDSARALAYQYLGWQLRYTYRTWGISMTLQQRIALNAPIQLLVPECVPTPAMEDLRRKTIIKRVNERMKDIPGIGRFTYRPAEKMLESSTVKRGFKCNKAVYYVGNQWIRDFPNLTGNFIYK